MTETVQKWGESEFAALGKIVYHFSIFDWCAETIVIGFLGADQVALLTVAGEDISWKLDKLAVIAHDLLPDTETSTALRGWVKNARTMVERRNTLIHSVYLQRLEEEVTTRWKTSTRGGKWKATSEPIGLETLEDFDRLLVQGIATARSIERALVECPEWHGTPPKDDAPI